MSQTYWQGNQPYQSYHYNQPSYTYRDQTLFHPINEPNYHAQQRQRQFISLRFFIMGFCLLFAVGGAMILPLRYFTTYNVYQKGTCTITERHVATHTSKNKRGTITSRTYSPSFSYLVHPAHGGQVSTTGFDGPEQVRYKTYDEAQEVVSSYQLEETTACWYNPAEPGKAFLVFYGYKVSDAMLTYFLSLGGFGIFTIVIYLLFDWTVWRFYALWKRGVLTQGVVLRNEERRRKRGKYIVSIIGFQALEEQGRERQITVENTFPVGAFAPVCYDPLYPRYRRYGEWPSVGNSVPGLLGIGILFIAGSLALLLLWLVP